MTRGFIYKAFGRWYKNKLISIPYPVFTYRKRRNFFLFCLQGITRQISFSISKGGQILVLANLNGEKWDILTEFDLIEKRTPSGEYYCDLCFPESREYYGSRNELWEKHSFEPLFEWITEQFIDSKYLCFFRLDDSGSRWVEIVGVENYKKATSDECFVYSVPIVGHGKVVY